MFRACVIEDGVVTNIIKANSLDGHPDWTVWIPGVEISDLWDPQAGYSKPARDLDKEKAVLIEEIQKKRLLTAESGVDISGKKVPSNKEALVLFTSTLGYLEDKNKTVKRAGYGELTKQEVKALFDAVSAKHDAAFERESDLYDQIMAATTVEELDAIDITAGW